MKNKNSKTEKAEKLTFAKKIFSGRRKYLILGILLLGGFLVYRNYSANKNGVEKGTVEKGMVREELILSGSIKAERHAALSFQTSGELNKVAVSEGDVVKKGTILASLDTTLLYQSYLQAQATLRKYETSLDSVYDTVQGHENNESFAQRDARTTAEVNKDNAYRSFVAAQKSLANATLRAPFDGVVTSVYFPYTGINTSFTQPQVEIVDPETIYFEVSADQTEITKLKSGQEVLIVLDSYSDEEFKGTIEFIGITPKTGEVSAVYEVKVKFNGGSLDLNKFKIGMTGDARFVINEKDNVLSVSSDFVQADSTGRYLFLNDPKNKVYVEVGIEGEDTTEIISDQVKEGDTVYD
jgi:RND family efflux transporter MFP subunit